MKNKAEIATPTPVTIDSAKSFSGLHRATLSPLPRNTPQSAIPFLANGMIAASSITALALRGTPWFVYVVTLAVFGLNTLFLYFIRERNKTNSTPTKPRRE
jgi:hypothetical protein